MRSNATTRKSRRRLGPSNFRGRRSAFVFSTFPKPSQLSRADIQPPDQLYRSLAGIRLRCPHSRVTLLSRSIDDRSSTNALNWETLRHDWPPPAHGNAKVEPSAPVTMALFAASGGNVASPDRRNTLGRVSSSTAALLLAVAFAPMASGHEHGEENIPEGSTVSAEPIVCLQYVRGTGVMGADRMARTPHYGFTSSSRCWRLGSCSP